MKRIITLALAAGLFMGATAQANAAEIDVFGKIVMTGTSAQNLDLVNDHDDADGFHVRQRLEVGIDIQNSENLKAHIRFRAPSWDHWGSEAMAAGGGNLDILLKQAYVDWFVPTTDVMVRMGLQPVTLPTTLGSPIWDDTLAGVSVIAPINDMITLTGHWFRVADYAETTVRNAAGAAVWTDSATVVGEALDMFAITAPMNFDGFAITPWAAVAFAGEGFDGGAAINNVRGGAYTFRAPGRGNLPILGGSYIGSVNWWAGFSSELTMFDPFTLGVGFAYGASDYIAGQTNYDANGWIVDAKLSYATQYGTPALFGWYATGDDIDNNPTSKNDYDFGRMPFLGGGWGNITTAFFDQAVHGIAPTSGVLSPAGTWSLGLAYSGFQPMEDLTLGGHVMYVRGTNDFNTDGATFNPSYMSSDDSVIELAAYATYDIYKDLQAAVEVNYLIANEDENYGRGEDDTQNGLRLTLGFQYNF